MTTDYKENMQIHLEVELEIGYNQKKLKNLKYLKKNSTFLDG